MTSSSDSAQLSDARSALTSKLRRGRRVVLLCGILMAILGVAALLWPILFTFAATFMIGLLLLVSGVVLLFEAFCYRGTGPFFGALFLALLTMAVGAFLALEPTVGAVLLTILIAVVFLFGGAFELVLALQLRHLRSWWWHLLSALVGITAGLLIAAGLPGSSLFVLGLVVGIKFLASGIAFITLAQSLVVPAGTSGLAKVEPR